MFLCLSLNPAVDRRLKMDQLQVGKVNRVCQADEAPGGKAAHVAMVLRTLGAAPLWLGFAGGTTGASLIEGLRQMGIRTEAVPMRGKTRTNLEILEAGERVTEILEPGPEISSFELEQFQSTFESMLAGAENLVTVILSGSLPPGVPQGYYAGLIRAARKLRARVFLDTSGEPLRLGLAADPDFVKPNQEEAESWSGRSIDGIHSAREVLKQLLEKGAAAGAISLGSDGLVWGSRAERETLVARIPKQSSPSCVGSGDATLAGFAFASEKGWSPQESVRIAAACGVANCIGEGPGRALAADIARLEQEIHIETLE
jgi:tagatose 6-phosphate kinase